MKTHSFSYMPTIDQDRIRWPGSGSKVQGATPFGTYDDDPVFVKDCENAARWAAFRLGYPVTDIELLDVNFYAAFEESVNVYNSKVNEFNMINNMFVLQGQRIDQIGNLNNRAIIGTGLPFLTQLASDYGTEAGTGGKVDWKKTFIQIEARNQDYDLQSLIGDVSESCARITIRRIFHNRPPASARIYDPFSMTGMSYSNVLTELGFGAYSPAVQFLMTPIFEDLLRMQAIEFNDVVRKSQYSFQLINNKLRIFPIPTFDYKLWIEYTNDNEVFETGALSPSGSRVVSDFSNVPYTNHAYTDINDPGRQWIRNYFLANCKEMLGSIRQKYQTIPIPGGEVTLDGAELRSEAQQEKQALIDTLKELLEAAGKFNQMEKQSQMAEQLMENLKKVPIPIYIG
jgi:hypothetical protein